MNRRILPFWFPLLLLLSASILARAQTFVGTNAPGQGTNFTITLGAGATNLSLVISNNAAAYSYLLLKQGGVPTDTVFDFVARLNGQTNEINLQSPEFVAGTYGLRVSTPAASGTHAFQVVMTTNRTDLRSAGYPALKPLVFSTPGFLTNNGSGAWHYFQVDMPSNLLTGWRIVLSSTNTSTPDLYIRRGALPSQFSYDKASTGKPIDTIIFTAPEATNSTYFIGVYQPSGPANSANYVLSTELASITTLAWDPGTTDAGTQVFTNQSATGGDYYFAITTLSTADGVWRTALNVLSNEADVYLQLGSLPSTTSYNYGSARIGSDGFVLSQLAGQFAPGQNWYILVHALPGAQWNLLTGEAYVQQLPALAADASSGAGFTMGAEGMHFFKTTISANTLAWRLGLNGLNNAMYVKQTFAPHPASQYTSYDLTQPGQMLVVPAYLTIGSQYFVGVVGNPGQAITLDSRQQPVTDLSFNSITNFTASGYGYTTFLVQVPVQQIAWQLNLTPTSGDASIAVRRDNVPNEFVNDAFSEVPAPTADSVTLVPPTLSNGPFYVTVYGTGPYTVSLFNGQPVITDVHYVFSITNDAPNRAGWRFYRIVNTAEQLGSLGWELDLTNQVLGSEIAIRRNAVPGRWNFRNNPYNYSGYSTLGYVDISSTVDFLQQPNHPADIWYIGVYTPATALGSFVLTGSQLTGPPVAFDGAGSSMSIANQPVGKFQYFTFTVPPEAFGWDLRITNVTVGAGGNPYLYICHDQLPSQSNPYGWNPTFSASWPSGYQWQAGYDWTQDYYNSDGSVNYGRILAMGMGNPLQAGTYYVGVLNTSGSSPISYTLLSRGIGTNFTIPITPLAFSNGVVSNPSLPTREAAYYSIIVPTNLASWRMELSTNIGDALLMLEKDALPSIGAGGYPPYYLYGGRRMSKVGNEQYLYLPVSGQTNIIAGTYYLAVASEGMNPNGGTIGTNSSSYTFTSFGPLGVTNIGTVDASGVTDIIVTNSSLKAGQFGAYQFSVPPNTLSLEVYLENKVGNPIMLLRTGDQLTGGYDSYGVDGGQGYTWNSTSLINIANPVATNYTLMVQAIASGGDAGYRVRVHAIGPQPVSFDGGSWTINNQAVNNWQYFIINVPPEAFGWDLRITNVTVGSGGNPYVYVCRDTAPSQSNPYGWNPTFSASWPSGYQWQAGYDWTQDYYNSDGSVNYGRILAMGMGNPLQAGTYYVGVLNTSGSSPISYTLLSRGIGTNFTIPITPLAFSNGVVSNPSLPTREAAYYSIIVPTNLASWRMELSTNIGDALLMLEKDALPGIGAGGYPPNYLYGGRRMSKVGNEQYLYLPVSGQTNIIAGTYYLAVASEGMNPNGGTIGTNSSSYSLTSFGPLGVTNIGTVDASGVTDIIVTNNSLKAGQFGAYQFSVPPNTLSLEVYLENKVGNPMMLLRTGNQLTGGYDSYGVDGGQGYTWNSTSLINIANPVATNYTLMVQAIASGGDAGYRVRVHAIGPQPVVFDGGSWTINNQAVNNWQYFIINVPPEAFGWDLRITNVTVGSGGNPYVYVCRDTAPSQSNPYGWNPTFSATWPSGYQWQAGYDWTQDYYNSDGSVNYGRVLAMGMGNPLQAGTYYVGVLNTSGSSPISYTLLSRGIGTNFAIPITPLAFSNGIATNLSLAPREAAYYKIIVPTNTPDWKLRLSNVSGEALFMVEKDALPSIGAGGYPPYYLYGGRRLQKAGNEQYLYLPVSGQTNVIAGTYYLAVASEGVNPNGGTIGTNASSFTMTSYGVQGITNLGTVGVADLLNTNALQGGENAFFRFAVPAGAAAVEVRLDDVTGAPYMTMVTGTNLPSPWQSYGVDGGAGYAWSSSTLLTLPNPIVTNYSLGVQAASSGSLYPDANFTVHIRQMPTPLLTFDPSLNGGGLSNVAAGALLNGQSAFYKVVVPATLNGQPVIGWKLDVARTSGTPSIRVRQNLLPNDATPYAGNSPFVTSEAILVPPFLSPGTWYVEVRGVGLTSYTLTSSNLQLKRPLWVMPVEGNPVTTPGLPPGGPLFGDTGVDTGGVPLPGDQGIDLAQGAFDYYAVSVPPGNIGVIRTRLDAISGNPNMFIRVGGAPTLSHYQSGDNGPAMYDRNLSASGGSEYGNWVPLNGRYEGYLTAGTWYFAVQAGGNSNVRYRLRFSTGIVNDLALNGGSYSGQNLAAGDWLYYRVRIPTNAPVNWNVTFSQELGNVVMYVRDRVPPGHATTTTDYRDWNNDSKNHGPYPNFDPAGTYPLTTPPLRPGSTYFLGFRAVSDATFTVGCNTNGGYIDYTNTIGFYGGGLNTSVPAHGALKLRIDVPPDGQRLILNFTNVNAFNIFLDQGSVPTMTTSDNWYSFGNQNPVLNQPLYSVNGWPWLPNYMYFLFVTNNTASAQSFAFGVDGRNCATDDFDNDGLPDCWELTYWPSIYSYGPNQDPDLDGVRNLDEYIEGTDPTNPLSFHPRLLINAQYGTVSPSPAGNPTTTPPQLWFNLNQTVQLTATPSAGYGFLGWSGDASGSANPLTLTMDAHKNVTAIFGVTNQPNADYLFQNNLHSSVGTPPDLTDIVSGNTFVSDVVDGGTRTVYRFPQGRSVQLAPADGVIPTNVYTMVMLFELDAITGWRRVLDTRNPPNNNGLYAYYGSLYFYPVVNSPSASIQASNYAQVVITRDASSNVVGYVNGVQQFTFVDNQNYATLSGAPQMLRFFKDDSTEEAAGAVARIRLYDKVMPPAQVAALDRLPGGVPRPTFDDPYVSGGVLNLPAQLTPGLSYRLQASTNLVNWINLSTNIPSASPFTFTDPIGPVYPERFYRLVTP